MSAKIWVPLVLSLVLGLGAALVAGKMLRPRPASVSTGATVVVAAHDIDPGTKLTAADLTTVKYPPKEVPTGAVTDPRQLLDRVSVAPLLKGQMAAENLLAPSGMPAGLQSLVPSGMRAVTLEINEFSGLAGMITPGEQVDVIANIRDDKTHETAARTIVQDLRVLAVGRQLGAPSASPGMISPVPNCVTLLVSPRQAQAIQLASQGSRPWLVLRGYKDAERLDPGVTSLAELRGESDDANVAKTVATTEPSPTTQPGVQPVVAVKPADPIPVRVVRLILGNDETRLTFQDAAESNGTQTTTTDPSDVFSNH